MKCAWEAYLRVLPLWMRKDVDVLGRETLQELRLRIDRPPEIVTMNGCVFLDRLVSVEDLEFCINTASAYSPWVASTAANGYLTAVGGHRIGICGSMIIQDGKIRSVTAYTSMCIRVARDYPGIAMQVQHLSGSILIIGSPGRGKTTFLRDLIRQKSNHCGCSVGVVDERGEVFPMVAGSFCFSPGIRTDVLSGCNKSVGIEMLTRTMSPKLIAVDEITSLRDTKSILYASGCGVDFIATAHAENLEDFMSRSVYRPLIDHQLFRNIIVMNINKSWTLERINI